MNGAIMSQLAHPCGVFLFERISLFSQKVRLFLLVLITVVISLTIQYIYIYNIWLVVLNMCYFSILV